MQASFCKYSVHPITPFGSGNTEYRNYESNSCVSLGNLFYWLLSFFLSFWVWPLLPIRCRCRRLLLHVTTLTHRIRQDSSGQVISPSQTSTWQHTTLTTTMPPVGFEPTTPACERPQTYGLSAKFLGPYGAPCAVRRTGHEQTTWCSMSRTFGVLDTAFWAAPTFMFTFCPTVNCTHKLSFWIENVDITCLYIPTYLVPTGIRSRTVQPVVSRYTDWTTQPTLDITTFLKCSQLV